jgi:hypothetical protein
VVGGQIGDQFDADSSEKPVQHQLYYEEVCQLYGSERDEVLYQLKLQDLRREIQIGLDAAERGDVVSLEELNEHLDAIQSKYLERQK